MITADMDEPNKFFARTCPSKALMHIRRHWPPPFLSIKDSIADALENRLLALLDLAHWLLISGGLGG
jgi:hypothetical protein